MAIQHRRGVYSKFDPSKLVPGEWAVVQSDDPNASDGKAAYICLTAGTVKRITTAEELAAFDANISAAINTANTASSSANAAASAANAAAYTANTTADDVVAEVGSFVTEAQADIDAALDAIGDISEVAVPLMSSTTRGGAKLGGGLEVDSNGKINLDVATSATGTTVTADDASCLESLVIEGKSVQAGTPTPSSPIPIQVVEPPNLCDSSRYGASYTIAVADYDTFTTATVADLPYTRNADGTITASGTATGNSFIYFPLSRVIQVGETVTLTGCPSGGSTTTYRVDLYATNNTIHATDSGSGVTKTVTVAIDRIRIACYAGDRNLTFKPQLVIGSSANPYTPYGCIGVNVKSPNLIDWSDMPERTNNGVTWKGTPDGWVYASGTATATSYAQAAPTQDTLSYGFIAYCEPGTYTAHGDGVPFNVFSMDATATGTALRTYSADSYTFTLTEARYIQLGLRVASGTVTNKTYHVQLVKGSAARPYTPYSNVVVPVDLNGNFLASLPDGTKDELTVDGAGAVTLTKRVGKRVFDGLTETWYTYNFSHGAGFYATPAISDMYAHGGNMLQKAICSAFVIVAGANTLYDGMMYFDNSKYASLINSNCATVDAMKSWLMSNNVEVYYQLATPQTITLDPITMPEISSGGEVSVVASVTPTITASLWAEGAKEVSDAINALEKRILETPTVSSIATGESIFTGNASALESLMIEGKSVQNGTPTPSSPVSVQVVEPAQLLTFTPGTSSSNGITSTIAADGTWTISGTATADVTCYYTPSSVIPIKAGDTVTISGMPTEGYSSANWRVALSGSAYFASANGTLTSASAGNRGCHVQVKSGYTMPTGWTAKPMMVRGSFAKEWTPHGCIGLNCGNTPTYIDLKGNFLASLPDGTKDELSIDSTGAVTLTKRVGKTVISGGTSSTSGMFGISTSDGVLAHDHSANLLCDSYPVDARAAASMADKTCKYGATSTTGVKYIYFKNSDYGTAAAFNAALEANPVTAYYLLATEQTITLDPITMPEIESGDAVSIVAAVTPTITLGWWTENAARIAEAIKSLKSAIFEKVGNALAASIATVEGANSAHNYSVGSYLMQGEQLYKVTSAIASGEAIVPGTNVTATTVMAEIVSLTS